jgi:hypothetical protein
VQHLYSVDSIFLYRNDYISSIVYKKSNVIICSGISGITLLDTYIIGHINTPIIKNIDRFYCGAGDDLREFILDNNNKWSTNKITVAIDF